MSNRTVVRFLFAVVIIGVGSVACEVAPPEAPAGPRYTLSRMYTATRERVTWRAPETRPESFTAIRLEPLRLRASPYSSNGPPRFNRRGIDTTTVTYERVFRTMFADVIPLVDSDGPGVLTVSASLTERVDEPHLRELAQRFKLADVAGKLRGIGLEMTFRQSSRQEPIAALISLESSYMYPAALSGQDPDPARAFQPIAMALKLALARLPSTQAP